MSHFKNEKKDDREEKLSEQPLVLDGTVSLEDNGEERPPRIKGLVELIHQYYSESRDSKS